MAKFPRTLKKYTDYIALLLTYAEASGIKVKYKEEPCDGVYDHNTNTITIDEDLEESAEIATLLHELGHAIDNKLMLSRMSDPVWKCYDRVYESQHSQEDLEIVMEAEKQAWQNGRVIAKRLKIQLGAWYSYEQKTALTNYRKT